ncbi:MAG: DNA replication/repair protein RecF [Nitratireductor sp.]|nr:DNA replication/repair protein RecF [Nitratireductor sp.]
MTARVHLTRLKLEQFRNYARLALTSDERHVVLTGENGAGKTNLLEAVSYLSPGRGLRRAPYDTIARKGSDGAWSVFAEMESSAGPVSIGTGLQMTALGLESQRRVRINGAQVKSADALLEHARVVWLTPAMDGLFIGPASDRRKFLDRLVLAVNPGHGRHVADFEKAMRSRNRLLGEDMPDATWLDAIETQMAETGIAIVIARMELASLLSGLIVRESDPASPFPDAVLALDGTLDALARDMTEGAMAASELEELYQEKLKSGRRLDAAAGRTLEGPHRTDLKVTHRPKAMAAELCSTGEQKALLVGILLAHARLVRELAGAAPILLLDEIAAHLDSGRRAALFDRIEALDCQAWMTGTDRSLFEAMGERAQHFTVAGGTIAPAS